jgi:selenide,water dikinase
MALNTNHRLTSLARHGGCAAKVGPGELSRVLAKLVPLNDPAVLLGFDTGDDAGVYRLGPDLALVQTLDFLTPIVDDPYSFGQIAVANALSDVYAKGARPLTAMNIICFPTDLADLSVMEAILRGGMDKLKEAGVALVGGHTVDDVELKYGLSVTGVIRPADLIANAGACPGDVLILTKPIGTGILTNAMRVATAKANGGLSSKTCWNVVDTMSMLNRIAAEVMMEIGVNACTDVTGFGLLGHARAIASASSVGIELDTADVPYLPGVRDLAEPSLCSSGLHSNASYLRDAVHFEPSVDERDRLLLLDPQTSGGLLMSVPATNAGRLLAALHQCGVTDAAIIGRVTAGPAGFIRVV